MVTLLKVIILPTVFSFLTRADIQSSVSVSCNFENGPCGWKNLQSDSLWLLGSGSTPSANTGPRADHTLGTSSGHYIYIEASGTKPQDAARLVSQPIASGTYCFQFWYHMFGDTMGVLKVAAAHIRGDTLTATTLLFRAAGDHGDLWIKSSVTVTETSPFMLVIESQNGLGIRSDMAVDDVLIELGPCYPTL